MKYNDRDLIVELTPQWKGDRFDDGRPRVSDDILNRVERITTEEAWAVLHLNEYRHQFEAGLKAMHPERILVARAVTAVFVPARPDLHGYLMDYGHEVDNRIGMMNSWVIETLVKDDVIVVDLFDKIFEGTYSGGNLSTAIATRTGRGQIIWGGIRDIQQIYDIEGFQTYYRGYDPTGIRDVTLVGLNIPCRIGQATCMPGDVVLGTMAGVLFIPPHLAEESVEHAEKIKVREIFGLERIRQRVYTSAEMDTKWTTAIEADFADWRLTNTPDEFIHLTWDEETKIEQIQTDQETLL